MPAMVFLDLSVDLESSDLIRFQKAGPDYLPLSNGKKPNFRASTIIAPSNEDGNSGDNGRTIVNGEFFDGAPKGIRFRSPSRPKDLYNNNLNHSSGSGGGAQNLHTPFIDNNHHWKPKNHSHSHSNSHSHSPGHRLDSSPTPTPSPSHGDVLMQWRQRKRSRVSRSEIRSSNVTDDSSSSSGQGKQPDTTTSFKLRRRSFTANMPPSPSPPPPPPPPPLPSTSSPYRNNSRIVSHQKNGLTTRKESSGFISSRNLDDNNSTIPNGIPTRNVGSSSRVASRSAAGKRPMIPSPDKVEKKISCSGSSRDGKQSESIPEAGNRTDRLDFPRVQSGKEAPPPAAAANAGLATKSVEKYPKIHVSLSRKEKEEDFLAMTGNKLPHKPKKRPRAVDKALQHCFPGMWLSELSKSRYEVREKKSTKKPKWTGLKGMESESD